ncbi:MAG: hypothetical protein SPH79_09675 [Schaalia hyovaginalis]|uniref:hypothetical protein n=1 Tax=Schaalia hyovaginalis TaxID=29316 RepID=UPI002A912800|nr:hypothetical protein [Schaalia hyovaginalis]MDY6214741.1 hypothetical protein [Schaalia hyovaginalis]
MSDTYLQVLTEAQAKAYLSNTASTGIHPGRIAGFFCREADVAGLKPVDILAAVRPEHQTLTGAYQQYNPRELHVLIVHVNPDVQMATTSSTLSEQSDPPLTRFSTPVTGTGFAASTNDSIIPEYLSITGALLAPGDQIRRIDADGVSTVLATYSATPEGAPRWISADAPDEGHVLLQDGEHALFMEIGGHALPAYMQDPDHLALIAPDSRAAWFCHPAADAYVLAGPGRVLSIYSLAHIDSLHRLETTARWQGLTICVEGITDEHVDALFVGRPYQGMAEAGFVGDQYHGFRARLPRSEVSDYTIAMSGLTPGRRPVRPDEAAPFLSGEEAAFKQYFLHQQDRAPLPLWAAPGPDGRTHPVIRVPDRRALQVMVPGCREAWADADGGALVPITQFDPGASVINAVTRLTDTDGDQWLCQSVSSGAFLAQRILPDGVDPQLQEIPPTRIRKREDILYQAEHG